MDFEPALVLVFCYGCLQILITAAVGITASWTIFRITKSTQEQVSTSQIIKLWGKTTWKMRCIYGSLLVHIFDFFTDLLVLYEWFVAEENGNEIAHIDSKIMAYSSIGVLIFYKIVSSFAIYIVSERDWQQSILQFFDLLLFIEIYNSHKKLADTIVAQALMVDSQTLKISVGIYSS